MKPKKNKHNGVEILLAEDSATQREQLQHLLEEHGYKVAITANGKEALASARRRKPVLIISDVIMPEIDGYGLCKAVKSDATLKDIPVILVTSLSDSQDVVRGLECGADNFIRKPYDGAYLLSRIEYLLMNRELRKNHKMQLTLEINLGGRKHLITSGRQQILDLLISTYEQAVAINDELKLREKDLAHSSRVIQGLYRIADGLNHAISEREVAATALERALELPGIQAGWISLREGESGFRLAAARGVPPALCVPDAFDGSCTCQRRLLSGELDAVANILECERLGKARGDTQEFRLHASVPLWLGSGHHTLGVMNLAGPGDKLFDAEELKIMYSVGNQVAVALERARLHEHLEQLVEERTARLAAEVEERKRAEGEVRALSADLERRVEERTRELAMANKELESFSYSVSHDLRAPLRAIGGFSEMLKEDHAAGLDDEGKRLIQVIRVNTRNMGQLIDDLLAFSRLGRGPISTMRIDTGKLVGEVLEEVQAAAERRANAAVGPLPPAYADAALIRQVWINLLSNAVKFSGNRDDPRIEVSAYDDGADTVYCVKDNGAGFDMQYYNKLFGVFQRLHSADEFQGTGVGLAIVQRIVSRHGGRAWAEGKVGEGAAFYFSLPKGRRDG